MSKNEARPLNREQPLNEQALAHMTSILSDVMSKGGLGARYALPVCKMWNNRPESHLACLHGQRLDLQYTLPKYPGGH